MALISAWAGNECESRSDIAYVAQSLRRLRFPGCSTVRPVIGDQSSDKVSLISAWAGERMRVAERHRLRSSVAPPTEIPWMQHGEAGNRRSEFRHRGADFGTGVTRNASRGATSPTRASLHHHHTIHYHPVPRKRTKKRIPTGLRGGLEIDRLFFSRRHNVRVSDNPV